MVCLLQNTRARKLGLWVQSQLALPIVFNPKLVLIMKKHLPLLLIGFAPSLALAHPGHAALDGFHLHGVTEFLVALALGVGAYLLFGRR
ncbi:MAG: hypothetical protein A2527_14375 [Candidatus Lambdaproteobacteria bacterium RIFOXYD2_FULL_50_16]|uniref:Uncharacterized protein n=1 Tax=Candidatus Lambdaproteobacteria bacterium RIFOXYD2_FULL_50_16 TaxID=1817772 RepID=A0A1F6G4S7_9PROT|nr:MAG: hypothetical protein A2527_14375 [Candidatus Lambdaproteobacteria bacterium RIFOXYD2_FULL_50_16]